MKSITTREFRTAFRDLPADVRRQARVAYRLFQKDRQHPGLQFKKLKGRNYYSVRIGLHYRAVATVDGENLVWFWIGPHSAYDYRT